VHIPLDFWNVSLWLSATSIILIITAQLVSARDGPTTLLIDSRKLKTVALTMGVLFLATVAIHAYGIMTST
jgi:hypothetical protein